MLWVLVKKQLMEVFRSYFYDAKKNKMRSKRAIAGWILFFIILMAGVLGGMFTVLASTLCGPLAQIDMGWLYFLIMCGTAIFMGAFGSVFNTFSALYLAKDNDLLLSLPIPVKTILASRLINVYLLGTMYSATALIPTLIVYWVTAGVTAARVICGLLLFAVVTLIVLLLSCLLGWVVAKISLRLKNKSFITVLIALVFIAAYYFFYFKASILIQQMLLNAVVYGEKIRGAAYGLYLFGRIGEGSWTAAAVFAVGMGIISALIWIILYRSFLGITTASGRAEKTRYVEKAARKKTVFAALLGKEFGRFTSSANYMLNCGLGVVMIPVAGILLLIKGQEICRVLDQVFAARPGTAAVLICTMLFTLSSMTITAVPSVSLEGKSIWIPQSLPVEPRIVLRAKVSVQLILSVVPVLFASLCAAAAVNASLAVKLLMCAVSTAYTVFSAMYGMVIGLKMPLLSWTNELAPIKQSGGVIIAVFSSWGFSIAFAGLYLLAGYRFGPTAYLSIGAVLFGALSLLFHRWLDTRGSRIFAGL